MMVASHIRQIHARVEDVTLCFLEESPIELSESCNRRVPLNMGKLHHFPWFVRYKIVLQNRAFVRASFPVAYTHFTMGFWALVKNRFHVDGIPCSVTFFRTISSARALNSGRYSEGIRSKYARYPRDQTVCHHSSRS